MAKKGEKRRKNQGNKHDRSAAEARRMGRGKGDLGKYEAKVTSERKEGLGRGGGEDGEK